MTEKTKNQNVIPIEKKKNKTRKKPPADNPISQNVARLIEEQGLKDGDVHRHIGWDSATLSRKIGGDRKWSWDDIKKIAQFLRVQPYSLLLQPQDVPLIRFDGHGLFDCTKKEEMISARIEGVIPEHCYVLILEDRSLMPGFPPGTKFLAQMEDWEEIKENDLVVYTNPDNKGFIYRISFQGDRILLKSLNPALPDLLLPQAQIRQCDRIFRAEF